jgi:hypothetical protein
MGTPQQNLPRALLAGTVIGHDHGPPQLLCNLP